MSVPRHPYAHQRIGLATLHAKERALAPPFRRLLGAEIVVAPHVDTDSLGTFSGEIPRTHDLVETALVKAEMAFATCDLDCAIASEGSYGPIESVPLTPGGLEIMALIDRKRGLRLVETMQTHRTNWRLWRFGARDPRMPAAAAALGFPEYGIFVMRNSDHSAPVKGLATMAEAVAAVDHEAERSDDGLALLIADMRAHRNPTRMKVLRALGAKLARRLGQLCPRCRSPGFGHIDSRRGLPCEACAAPTQCIEVEIDGCPACGHATARARRDGRRTAPRLSCHPCRESRR